VCWAAYGPDRRKERRDGKALEEGPQQFTADDGKGAFTVQETVAKKKENRQTDQKKQQGG